MTVHQLPLPNAPDDRSPTSRGAGRAAHKAENVRTGLRRSPVRPGDSRLAKRLADELQGDVLFDGFSRGRYATDASVYQIDPVGVVVPERVEDVRAAFAIAAEEGVPLLPRGGGSSQCGQTVGECLVLDTTKHLNKIKEFDPENRRVVVEPGLVLDHLNAFLKPHGLWFPVDVSTGSRATIGGMTANNSCGSRSLRYGNMVHNVHRVRTLLAQGDVVDFGPAPQAFANLEAEGAQARIIDAVSGIVDREWEEIGARFPKVQRNVAGYRLEMLPRRKNGGFEPAQTLGGTQGAFGADYAWGSRTGENFAALMVGSEGTLGFFEEIELYLEPLPTEKVLGVCHFPTFYAAMENTQHIVPLMPTAVELVDSTLISLAREIPIYRSIIEQFVKGEPEALLLVEFAGDDRDDNLRRLAELNTLMADLGFAQGVVDVTDGPGQKSMWDVRKACLNIAMSMKGDAKPVSFIEDCAVRLEDLAAYTDRLTKVFHKHGTEGTWYAHASVGTLHVRPILNLKTPVGTRALRAIAEEAFDMVMEYKGAYSGEHGDGIVRSEFHEPLYGSRIQRAFEDVKDLFDPQDRLNPGKVVRPYRMDDRTLFRYKPDYEALPIEPAMDWSAWGGFLGAVEMCNNNGTCRKSNPGVMCPSYRVTKDEQHLTRGRANSLRLALTGQLGPEAFTSEEMAESMALCVGCKGCKRECPTSVDMAKMKVEFLHHYNAKYGARLKDRFVAYLPRYAPFAARLPWLLNLRDKLPGAAKLSEWLLGFSAKRTLPAWRSDFFKGERDVASQIPQAGAGQEVVFFADTFNTYYEPENARAAIRVLKAAGYRIIIPQAPQSSRPLCCGRTFLAAGMVDRAREEMRRSLEALGPYLDRDVPIVGLEPSCLLTFRDEFKAVVPGEAADRAATRTYLFEEFLAAEHKAGRLTLPLKETGTEKILLHGHCHQKAFDVVRPVEEVLGLLPGVTVELIESSCCGMAGSFGYEEKHYDVSMKMAELSLLPAIRAAAEGTVIAADGTSCRHQIADGAGRQAKHVARILEDALDI